MLLFSILLPLQGRNACSKFKGGLWERARCFYLACVRAQASERTLLCPTLCLTQARLPGVVRLNASKLNADETFTPGRRQEPTMHIVPEFCFRFSFIWSINTLCCFLPLLYKNKKRKKFCFMLLCSCACTSGGHRNVCMSFLSQPCRVGQVFIPHCCSTWKGKLTNTHTKQTSLFRCLQ